MRVNINLESGCRGGGNAHVPVKQLTEGSDLNTYTHTHTHTQRERERERERDQGENQAATMLRYLVSAGGQMCVGRERGGGKYLAATVLRYFVSTRGQMVEFCELGALLLVDTLDIVRERYPPACGYA